MVGSEHDITLAVLGVMERIPDPRLREIMVSLVKRLHGFVREVPQARTGISHWLRSLRLSATAPG